MKEPRREPARASTTYKPRFRAVDFVVRILVQEMLDVAPLEEDLPTDDDARDLPLLAPAIHGQPLAMHQRHELAYIHHPVTVFPFVDQQVPP